MLVSQEWLERTNKELSERNVPHAARPWDAIDKLSFERVGGVSIPSPVATQIFQWFEANSPKGSHLIGALFTAAYYFDAYFWKVTIPFAYGIVRMDALDSIDMPLSIKTKLTSSKTQSRDYAALWIDAMDYGYAQNDVRMSQNLNKSAKEFFASGDRELRTTVTLLVESPTPSPKAMETSRMCVEMFMKAYLCAHEGKEERELKTKFGHNLQRLIEECVKHEAEFSRLQGLIGLFPEVGSRYKAQVYPRENLWSAYCVAQCSATIVVRSLTDRDSREQMFGDKFMQSLRAAKARAENRTN